MQGLPPGLTLPGASVIGKAEEGLRGAKTSPRGILNPFPHSPFLSLPQQQGPSTWGAWAASDFSKQLSCLPQVCLPPLIQAVAPPSRGDVSPAPPPTGALWPNMANTAVLGSWDRLGGRGGGPWLGLLAAGEGEGRPGGGCKGDSRREAGPPSLPLAGRHMQDPLSKNSCGQRHQRMGPQVTPSPHSHA